MKYDISSIQAVFESLCPSVFMVCFCFSYSFPVLWLYFQLLLSVSALYCVITCRSDDFVRWKWWSNISEQ